MGRKREITPDTRRLVLESADYSCIYCAGEAAAVDHIVPHSQTQDDDPINLVASCATCNGIAGSKVFEYLSEKAAYIRQRRIEKHLPLPPGIRVPPKRPVLKNGLASKSRFWNVWQPILENMKTDHPRARMTAMKNAQSNITYQDLEDYFGVSKGLIWKIINEGHTPVDERLRERLGWPEMVVIYHHRDKQGRFVRVE